VLSPDTDFSNGDPIFICGEETAEIGETKSVRAALSPALKSIIA
jgi:hypothetical protein